MITKILLKLLSFKIFLIKIVISLDNDRSKEKINLLYHFNM